MSNCKDCKTSTCKCKSGIEMLNALQGSGGSGVSITNVVVNGDNTMTFTFSDGTVITTGSFDIGSGLSYVWDHYYGTSTYTQHDIALPAGLLSANGDTLKIHARLNNLTPTTTHAEFVSLNINYDTSPGIPTETVNIDRYLDFTASFEGITLGAVSHIDVTYHLTKITNTNWMVKNKAFINIGGGEKLYERETFRVPTSSIPFATLDMTTENNILSLVSRACNINFVNVEVIKSL